MISFVCFGLVAVVFGLLRVCNEFIKDSSKQISVTSYILLIASYLFLIYADWRFTLVLFGLTLSTRFFAGKKYAAYGVVAAIAALAFFKYTNFFVESLSRLVGKDYTALKIILPLGISFYTFSAISYIVDVKRGKAEERKLKDVALYLAFFPKITSGPIQNCRDFSVRSIRNG